MQPRGRKDMIEEIRKLEQYIAINPQGGLVPAMRDRITRLKKKLEEQ